MIEAYERKHYPIDPPDPIAAIKFRMDQQGLTVKDLEPMIGRSNRVYEVLAGRRRLTLDMIRRLHEELGIPAEHSFATMRGLPSRHKRSSLKESPPRAGFVFSGNLLLQHQRHVKLTQPCTKPLNDDMQSRRSCEKTRTRWTARQKPRAAVPARLARKMALSDV